MLAFPSIASDSCTHYVAQREGTTLRGYSASKDLASIPAYGCESVSMREAKNFSKFAFDIADAILEEYSKGQ